MVNKEQNYRHGTSFLQKHPRLEPRMRSILLDWLIEVRLHIKTASLVLLKCRTECCPQFFSSNCSITNEVVIISSSFCKPGEWGLHSSSADLLPGAGLLWPVHVDAGQRWEGHAAAHRDNLSFYSIKDGGEDMRDLPVLYRLTTSHCGSITILSLQEACPPKLSQMAYVTAGTYYEEEILQMELIILKVKCGTCLITWLISKNWLISERCASCVCYAGVGLEPVSWNSRVLVDSLLPDGIDEQKLGPAGAAVFTARFRTNDPCRCLGCFLASLLRLACCWWCSSYF